MAFQLVQPYSANVQSLRPGEAGISKDGRVTLTTNDLRRHRIHGRATLLVDKATRRLAIREPKQDDRGLDEPSVKVAHHRDQQHTRRLFIKAALNELEISPEQVHGRHRVREKEDMLIIEFGIDAKA